MSAAVRQIFDNIDHSGAITDARVIDAVLALL
jgi:hypothetical protein